MILDNTGLTHPVIHLLCAFVCHVSSLGTFCAGGFAVAMTKLVLPHSEYSFQMQQLVSERVISEYVKNWDLDIR